MRDNVVEECVIEKDPGGVNYDGVPPCDPSLLLTAAETAD